MGQNSEAKAFFPLAGKFLFLHAVELFVSIESMDEVLVMVPEGYEARAQEGIDSLSKVAEGRVKVLPGGEERQDSVYNGLLYLSRREPPEIVVVHDCARPFVTSAMVEESIEKARAFGAAVVAIPCLDSLKEVDEEGFVLRSLNRSRVWQAQTPQTFHYPLLKEAHQKARADGIKTTDDASLVERLGRPVCLIMGSYENIKITTPQDLRVAEEILKKRIS